MRQQAHLVLWVPSEMEIKESSNVEYVTVNLGCHPLFSASSSCEIQPKF